MINIVGSKIFQMIAIVLVVGTILFSMTQYIQMEERDKVLNEVKIETLQVETQIREDVEDAVREALEFNPTRDGLTALDRLRDRQGD